MLLRQYFDRASYTYTYLLADEQIGAAAFIDPVAEQPELYLQFLDEPGLTLVLDTHVHADHITALGKLLERTGCRAMVGIKGWAMSTIGEEKRHNPRLQPATQEAFIECMNSLDPPNPKMMDIAAPANRACGPGND
jgi:glyoxylase-like metal-dependent hydrolase (beta-lactamase superfamily II)